MASHHNKAIIFTLLLPSSPTLLGPNVRLGTVLIVDTKNLTRKRVLPSFEKHIWCKQTIWSVAHNCHSDQCHHHCHRKYKEQPSQSRLLSRYYCQLSLPPTVLRTIVDSNCNRGNVPETISVMA